MFDVAEVHLALNRSSRGDGLFEDVLDVQTELQKQKGEEEEKKKRIEGKYELQQKFSFG